MRPGAMARHPTESRFLNAETTTTPVPPTAASRAFVAGLGLQGLTAAICVVLVLTPVVPIILQSVVDRPLYDSDWQFTLRGYRQLFGSTEVAAAMWNTLYFGLVSTVLSLVLGVLFAVFLGRTDLPFAGPLASVSLWPFYVSPIVLAIGWAIVYSPSGYLTLLARGLGLNWWNLYSIEGMAVVSAVSHAPITFLYVIGSVRQQDSALEDAALMAGARPVQILSRITLPLVTPALSFCIIMNVVSALEAFSIPLVLGVPSGIDLITSYIYRAGFSTITPNYPLVAAAAVVLVLIISLLTVVQLVLLRKSFRFTTVGGKSTRQRPFELGWIRWPVLALFCLYLLMTIVVPILGVFARSVTTFLSPLVPVMSTLSWANYQTIFSQSTYVNAIWNTLILAAGGGALATALIALIVFVAHRSSFPLRRALDFLAQYPRAIPGVFVGLGLFYLVAALPFLADLRNTLWILLIAYTIRFLPSGYSVIVPTMMQLSADFDRAGQTMGASWLTICLRIVVPLAKAALLACYCILVVYFTKEYSSAIFLYSPGTEVMGTVMLSFWSQGDYGPVAALAMLQMAAVAVFVFLSGRLFGTRFHG